jgi:hypothetical protein
MDNGEDGGFTLPVRHLNMGASEDLFAKMNKQKSSATRPVGSAKKEAPERR